MSARMISISALSLAVIMTFSLPFGLAQSAERRERICDRATISYDDPLAVVVASDGRSGACFFDVYLPIELAGTEPGGTAASLVREAFKTEMTPSQRLGLLEKAFGSITQVIQSSLSRPDFVNSGGGEILEIFPGSFESVAACFVDAFAGKEFEQLLRPGASLKCRVDRETNAVTMSLASSDVLLEFTVSLA